MIDDQEKEQGFDMGIPETEEGVGSSGVSSVTIKTVSLYRLMELSKAHVQDRCPPFPLVCRIYIPPSCLSNIDHTSPCWPIACMPPSSSSSPSSPLPLLLLYISSQTCGCGWSQTTTSPYTTSFNLHPRLSKLRIRRGKSRSTRIWPFNGWSRSTSAYRICQFVQLEW